MEFFYSVSHLWRVDGVDTWVSSVCAIQTIHLMDFSLSGFLFRQEGLYHAIGWRNKK